MFKEKATTIIHNQTKSQEENIGYTTAYQVFIVGGKKYLKIGNPYEDCEYNALELNEHLGIGTYGELVKFPSSQLVIPLKTTITTEPI